MYFDDDDDDDNGNVVVRNSNCFMDKQLFNKKWKRVVGWKMEVTSRGIYTNSMKQTKTGHNRTKIARSSGSCTETAEREANGNGVENRAPAVLRSPALGVGCGLFGTGQK